MNEDLNNQPTLEQSIRNHLPPWQRVVLHFLVLAAAAYLIGPWLGPRLFGFIDPQSTWGRGQAYQVGDVFNWGTLFLIAELLVYTAWIIRQGRKGWEEYQVREFRKALEGDE